MVAFTTMANPAAAVEAVTNDPSQREVRVENDKVTNDETQISDALPSEEAVAARQSESQFETTIRAPDVELPAAWRLSPNRMASAAGTLGDGVQIARLLPGVTRLPFGLGPLIVRGGRPGETRLFIDGHEVPTLFHFGGLTAVVPADSVSSLVMHSSGIPVNLSAPGTSAFSVQLREPFREYTRLRTDLSVAALAMSAEGPLNESLSGMAFIRRSWVDLLARRIVIWSGGEGPYFLGGGTWDYLTMLSLRMKSGNLSILAHGNVDAASVQLSPSLNARDAISAENVFHYASMTFRSSIDPPRRWLRGSVSRETWSTQLGPLIGTRVGEVGFHGQAQHDLDWLRGLRMDAGVALDVVNYKWNVRSYYLRSITADTTDLNRNVELAGVSLRSAVYFSSEAKLIERLSARVEGRGWYNSVLRRSWVDLHGGLKWHPIDWLLFQLLVATDGVPGTYLAVLASQLSRDTVLWNRATSVSLDVRIFGRSWSSHLSGFCRYSRGDAPHVDSSARTDAVTLFANYGFSAVEARGCGIDFQVKLNLSKRFHFDFSGGTSKVLERNAANTAWGDAVFGQRYSASLQFFADIAYGLSVSFQFRVTDGLRKIPLAYGVNDLDAGTYFPVLSADIRGRLPAIVQLNGRLGKKFSRGRWSGELYLEVLNMANIKNIEFEVYDYDYSSASQVYGMPLIPVLGVSLQYGLERVGQEK